MKVTRRVLISFLILIASLPGLVWANGDWMMQYYLDSRADVKSIEAALTSLQEQGEILKFATYESQLFVLGYRAKDSKINSILRQLGANIDELESGSRAERAYDRAIDHIEAEKRSNRSSTVQFTLAPADKVTQFVDSVRRMEGYHVVRDALSPGVVNLYLPYPTLEAARENLNDLLKRLSPSNPLSISNLRTLAKPGLESNRLINQLAHQNSLLAKNLELSSQLQEIDLSSDLISALHQFDKIFKTDASEELFDKMVGTLAKSLTQFNKATRRKIILRTLDLIHSDKSLSIREIERFLSIIQDVLLQPEISDAKRKDVFTRERADDFVPRALSDGMVESILKRQESGNDPIQLILEKDSKKLADFISGRGNPMAYMVFGLPREYHRSGALLIRDGQMLNVVLMDPLNISEQRIPRYNTISKTFQHISRFLSGYFPTDNTRFFTFDEARQKDDFSCVTYAMDDYEKLEGLRADLSKATTSLSGDAPGGKCVQMLGPIPAALLSSAQTSRSLPKKETKTAITSTSNLGKESKSELWMRKLDDRTHKNKPANGYILLKLVEYVKLIAGETLTFAE